MIVTPPQRDFPDAIAPLYTLVWTRDTPTLLLTTMNPGTSHAARTLPQLATPATAFFHLDPKQTRTLKVAQPSPGRWHYSFTLNQWYAAEVSPTQPLRIERIDVNHTLVTQEDGQQRYVKGAYKLEWLAPDGRWKVIVPAAATQTGVDVAPGEYRVTVTYATAEGTQSKVYSIVIP